MYVQSGHFQGADIGAIKPQSNVMRIVLLQAHPEVRGTAFAEAQVIALTLSEAPQPLYASCCAALLMRSLAARFFSACAHLGKVVAGAEV